MSAFLEHQSTDDLLEKAGIAVFAEGGQKEQLKICAKQELNDDLSMRLRQMYH
jgi:hypothetical protein